MDKSSYGKMVSKHYNDGNLLVKLRLEPKTLHIRTGISTAFTMEKNLILNSLQIEKKEIEGKSVKKMFK